MTPSEYRPTAIHRHKFNLHRPIPLLPQRGLVTPSLCNAEMIHDTVGVRPTAFLLCKFNWHRPILPLLLGGSDPHIAPVGLVNHSSAQIQFGKTNFSTSGWRRFGLFSNSNLYINHRTTEQTHGWTSFWIAQLSHKYRNQLLGQLIQH
jgi:hypothetical protein